MIRENTKYLFHLCASNVSEVTLKMIGKLTNSASKLIKSLQQKKYRDLNGLFVVEGVKLVGEAMGAGAAIETVVFTGDDSDYPYDLPHDSFSASPKELEIISGLKTPNRILAVCRKFPVSFQIDHTKPCLALDGISDPGNMGTIIRLCDWFGINQIVCDNRCVELYNPKVVQASMGSLFRVNVVETDLIQFISDLPEGRQCLAADMHGKSIYQTEFQSAPVIVMGSESHGLREEVLQSGVEKISIPQYGGGESLNVAVSAAIIVAEFQRHVSAR